jgi:uncharacterized protein YggE
MFKKSSVFGLVVLIILSASPASAVERYISVTATGTVKVKPDTVRINATTWAINSTSKEALKNTATASDKLRKVLVSNSISSKYVKSNSLTVFPEYNYTQDKGSILVGYKASQTFEIIVRNPANAGAIVDALVANVSDAINIDGVTPYIYDATTASTSARTQAVKNAKTKARSYAKLLGVTLGKIIYLDENSGSAPIPVGVATTKSDAGTTVIDLGTQDVSVNVVTRWAIN